MGVRRTILFVVVVVVANIVDKIRKRLAVLSTRSILLFFYQKINVESYKALLLRLQAFNVFRNSIAIVMGPTPPGTGVILEHFSKADS
jgi:hypothetical protein